MKRKLLGLLFLAAAIFPSFSFASSGAEVDEALQARCDLNRLPALPDVKLNQAVAETVPVAHCRVSGIIGTETGFELLLPANWNGKFLMAGGGGFGGFTFNTARPLGVLERGYATASTDTGHQGNPQDGDWALHNLERIVSFGHQAVHRTTVTAKATIAHYYGQPIQRNYFFGCSRGGSQGMVEAQRYPEDFDVIVAGAPPTNWVNQLAIHGTMITKAMYPDPSNLSKALLAPEDSQMIGEAVMAQCDGLDGLTDGIINYPPACDFDVASLQCGNTPKGAACLNAQKVAAARSIYSNVSVDGTHLSHGFPVGGELEPFGWQKWLTGGLDYLEGVPPTAIERVAKLPPAKTEAPSRMYAISSGLMKYMIYHNPNWNHGHFNAADAVAKARPLGQTLNATNPDLSEFTRHGGKLLMYSGWADMAISPLATVNYFDQVQKHTENAAGQTKLYMMPGVSHCGGGTGPSFGVNWVDLADQWASQGNLPDALPVYWLNNKFQPDGGRLACAHPKRLHYVKGDPRAPQSFICK